LSFGGHNAGYVANIQVTGVYRQFGKIVMSRSKIKDRRVSMAGFAFSVHCHMLRHACGYAPTNVKPGKAQNPPIALLVGPNDRQ
jgi:hypothetical protein